MAYDYPEVFLDFGAITTYQSFLEVEEYLAGTFQADAWRAADDDTKNRAIVTACRLLDRQKWKGSKNDTDNTLEWPRADTGVAGVEDDVIPDKFLWAVSELASALVDGSDVQDTQNQAQKIQSLRAGSVAITYFRGAEGQPLRFPLIVWELIRDFLLGTGNSISPVLSAGTDRETVSGTDFGFSRGL